MRLSKPWPQTGTVGFTELTMPVCDAIRFAYDLVRREPRSSIPWEGYNIGERDLTTCFPPHEALTLEKLEYDENDQGRDPLDVLVGIAIQLGIEQGRRMESKRLSSQLDLAKMLARRILRNEAAEPAKE